MWIQDLREICEKRFDNRETGQLEVESMRVEWHKAFSEKERKRWMKHFWRDSKGEL